jgi:hypothetical protein
MRLIDGSSGEVRSITAPTAPTYHTHPAFAPDGRHLAYLSCGGSFSCQVEVVELGADSLPKGEARHLTRRTIWPLTDAMSSVPTARRHEAACGRVDGCSARAVEIAGFDSLWPASRWRCLAFATGQRGIAGSSPAVRAVVVASSGLVRIFRRTAGGLPPRGPARRRDLAGRA